MVVFRCSTLIQEKVFIPKKNLTLSFFSLTVILTADSEYVSIFNGENLDGWTYKKTRNYAEEVGYVVKDKQLIANGRSGNLYTNKRYKNYSF